MCTKLARKALPIILCACSISANSTIATLRTVSDCLDRLATASEQTSSIDKDAYVSAANTVVIVMLRVLHRCDTEELISHV